jgi:hypothetical protein
MHHPSPFYALLEGAKPFRLIFPSIDGIGPYWGDDGQLVHQPVDELASEEIEAVQLGPACFRLACRCEGPFSGLRLHWGDEFTATPASGGSLTLTRVVTPQPYVHHRFLGSTSFSNDMPAAKLVHDLGGGWETVAVGILTLTVPAEHSEEFQCRLASTGIMNGATPLTGLAPVLPLDVPSPAPEAFAPVPPKTC